MTDILDAPDTAFGVYEQITGGDPSPLPGTTLMGKGYNRRCAGSSVIRKDKSRPTTAAAALIACRPTRERLPGTTEDNVEPGCTRPVIKNKEEIPIPPTLDLPSGSAIGSPARIAQRPGDAYRLGTRAVEGG